MDDVDAISSVLRLNGRVILALDFLDDVTDVLCESQDGEFIAVSDVNRASLVRVHQRDQPIHKIMDVLEGARLLAVAVHSHIFALQRLDNKVGDYTAIIGLAETLVNAHL